MAGQSTFQLGRKQLAALGMSLTRKDGEYRVAFNDLNRHEAEPSAYYTDDIHDAIATGVMMRQQRNQAILDGVIATDINVDNSADNR